MLLSARPLKDVNGVNSFEVSTQAEWTQGDTTYFYFQLIDSSLDLSNQGFNPAGRRYVPAAGATLQVIMESVDDAIKVTRYATQPFAQDGSIWRLQILATDQLVGSPQLRFVLTEGAVVTRGMLKLGVKIQSQQDC